jgi:2-polyprenyl-3-methyl-5-hydroxy-6-metoxy-1,4-benzoquinol methylase
VLDVGCFNGYVTATLVLRGYSVTAVDSYDDVQRARLFEQVGHATYKKVNLNSDTVFRDGPMPNSTWHSWGVF